MRPVRPLMSVLFSSLASFVLATVLSVGVASADTITFNGFSGSPLSYVESGWEWISHYSGNFSSGHLHAQSGCPTLPLHPSPELHTHFGIRIITGRILAGVWIPH